MLPVRVRERPGRLNLRDPLWDFENVLRGFFGDGGQSRLMTGGFDVDMWEDSDHVYIEAEMPGFKKDDLDVTLEGGVLTIRGKKEERDRKGTQHLSEVCYGEFVRSFTLPVAVDEEKVNAELKEGILKLTLNKKEEAKAHKIQVKGG
jgi:HSP20 family protein